MFQWKWWYELTSEPTANRTTSEDSNRIGEHSDSPTATNSEYGYLKSPAAGEEKETHLRLSTKQREKLQLKCISYLSEGLSINEISEKEGMTLWHVRQTLDGINQEARNNILSNLVGDRLAISVLVRLETNRLLIAKCTHIMNSSVDDRVILQACAQISSLRETEAEILSSANVIANSIKEVLVLPHRSNDNYETEDNDPNNGAEAAACT